MNFFNFRFYILLGYLLFLSHVNGSEGPCQQYGHVLFDYFCDPCDVAQSRYYVCLQDAQGALYATANQCGVGTNCRNVNSRQIFCDWPFNIHWTVEDECPNSGEGSTSTPSTMAPTTPPTTPLSTTPTPSESTTPTTPLSPTPSESTATTTSTSTEMPTPLPISSTTPVPPSSSTARSTVTDSTTTPSVDASTQPRSTPGGGMVVCYFTNWAQYRGAPWAQAAADLDPHMCTHIIYAFGAVSGNSVTYSDSTDINVQFGAMMAHKMANPQLKVLFSVGGWNAGTAGFSAIAGSYANRQAFIASAISFCRTHDFDGFDIDWEYPNKYNAAPADYVNYPTLIREFREAFEQEAIDTNRDRLLLAAAFGAGQSTIQSSYDIAAFHPYFDFMSLMTYDFHGSWDPYLELQSDLYPASEANDDGLNSKAAVDTFLSQGVPAEKLVLGIPMYGRSYRLCSASQHELRDAACGAGAAGSYTVSGGYLAYYEVCLAMQSAGPWTTVWDDVRKGAYSYNSNTWISYDNEQTIEHKMSFINYYGLGGAMIWDISLDDFHNVCGQGLFPLINAIKSRSASPRTNAPGTNPVSTSSHQSMPSQNPMSSSTVTSGVTNAVLDATQLCSGRALHDRFCDACDSDQMRYYVCVDDGGTLTAGTGNQCAANTKCRNLVTQNPNTIYCDWPENVDWAVSQACGGGSAQSTTPGSGAGSTGSDHSLPTNSPGSTITFDPNSGTGRGMLVCYFTNWAQYRGAPWTHRASDVDPHMCTHIIYAFGTVAGTTVSQSDYTDLTDQYGDMMAHKLVNPQLKVLLSVGGWNAGTTVFSNIAASPSSRQAFIASAISFCRTHDFDGFDIDWEYPNKYNGAPYDYTNYPILIRELREAFEEEAVATNMPRLLLAAAFGVGPSTIEQSYDINAFHPYFDFMSLMTYDYHGSWDGQLGLHADLYPESENNDDGFNCKYAVETFMAQGAPAEKLVLGLPMYGRSFSLCSSSQTSPGQPACGTAPRGSVTGENGYMAYFEICQAMQSSGPWETVFDANKKSAYSYNNNMWISYDNEAAIEHKMAFINEYGLGGAMIWDLSLDDFNNACGQGVNPLIQAVNDGLGDFVALSTTPVIDSGSTSSTVRSTPGGTAPVISTGDKKLVCYFTNWAQYRTAPWTQRAADIDPHMCTHIIYAFGTVAGTTVSQSDNTDLTYQYADMMAHKMANPQLKVLLSVGGWNAGTTVFSNIAASPSSRQAFIASAISFCRTHDFDGFDIDWEYPNKYNAAPADYVNYPILIQEFREAFEQEASSTNRDRLLLAAAFGVGPATIEQSYDISAFHQYFDFLQLMTYDYHGSWDGYLELQADLYPESEANDNGFNIQYAVQTFVDQGTPPSKLIVGVPLYGRTYRPCSAQAGLSDSSCGAGAQGSYTREAGYMAYFEICQAMQSSGPWTTVWNDNRKSTYSYNSNLWISYDDVQAIEHKMSFIIEHNLGGAMVWDLALDDFNNACGQGVNPLLTAIRSRLAASAASTVQINSTPTQSVTTDQRSTTDHVTSSTQSVVTSTSSVSMAQSTTPIPQDKKLVCYYSHWSQYYDGRLAFDATDVKQNWCTHIVFGWAFINDDYTVSLTQDNDPAMISALMDLKSDNSNLKILLGVGGDNFNTILHSLSNRSARRATFVQSIIDMIAQHGFDGMDLVWMSPTDTDRYTNLISDVRTAFDGVPGRTLLLSARFEASSDSMIAYDIPAIVGHLDWISLKTFDYVNSTTSERVNLHSALYCAPDATDPTLCAEWTVSEYLSRGIPAHKLILGVSFHGVGGILKRKRKNDIGDRSLGASAGGKFTNTVGFYSYYEVCLLLTKDAWHSRYIENQAGVMAYNRNTWIVYDDATTVDHKIDFIHANNLGGAAIPNMALDDFRGKCSDGKVPLIKMLKNGLL